MIYEWNSWFDKNEIMHERALTSFALYDLYRTHIAYEQ